MTNSKFWRVAVFIIALLGLIFAVYSYLIFAWIKPGATGSLYNFKRSIQNWYYGKLLHDPTTQMRWNPTPIDIVIPVVAKDYETLIWTVKNVRIFAMHNIGNIYLVAPAHDQTIKDFAAQNDCIFVDEKTILPNFANAPTRGWIIQQFIKLNADSFVQNDHYLVIDADTILIRPTTFMRKDKLLLQFHTDYGYTRKLAAANILKLNKVHNMDFTVHHMLFDKTHLQAMKQYIEKLHNKPWYEVVLNQIDVSEYELYAQYMLHFCPKETRIVPAKNIGILRKQLRKGFEDVQHTLNKDYKSVSAHSFWEEREL